MAIEENKTGSTSGKPNESGQTKSAPNLASQAENKDNASFQQTIKDTAGSAAGQVKDKAATVIDEQKSKVALGLSSVAGELRKAGGNLRDGQSSADKNYLAGEAARYGETLANKIESLSGYVENATIKDLTRDLEGFARKQPLLFVSGAFIVGILAARFLKSTAPSPTAHSFSGNNSGNNKSGDNAVNSQTALQNI